MPDLDLIQILAQTARNRGEVRLLNIYKGLPILFETNINSVGNFEILVSGSRQQLACLYYQRETYLQLKDVPFIIRSQVMRLNLAREEATLAEFEKAQNNIGKRTQIRVEPEDAVLTSIRFTGTNSEIVAPLADISAEGAGVYVEPYLFPPRLFQPGGELTMSITLPDAVTQKIRNLPQRATKPLQQRNLVGERGGKITITAQGKIVSTRLDAQLKLYRAGIRLYFQDLARMVILQYISQRQIEIIRDLRILSDELYRAKK